MTFVLAHLSDPHLGPLPRPRFHELMGKRTIGFLNWYRSRRGGHRAEILQAVIRDLDSLKPDHVAVAGDLVNIALPGEFAPARAFLERLGSPEHVSVVPGNHDAYVRAATEHTEHHWGDYMRSDALGEAPSPESPARFPYLRRRGPIALIGVSSAAPSGLFMATGKIGRGQLTKLRATLETLARESVFRVVMIHHPPTSTGRQRFKRLIDARAFRGVLRDCGADLVLHGHTHVRSVVWLDGPDKPIPAVGVPSVSSSSEDAPERAGYNLYRISAGEQGWRCEMVSRGMLPDGVSVGEVTRQLLAQ
jgi:3',5'-cyclic AMP phosphodiesterase CpdA